MNINGCVDGIRQWAEGNSMSGYKIGYVTGDNIKDKIPQLLKDGWTFPNFDYDAISTIFWTRSTTAMSTSAMRHRGMPGRGCRCGHHRPCG